jgi:cellulose synthase/poly-beta-1,6-N-acetylglucosamine synthase-like glycosyltransferase
MLIYTLISIYSLFMLFILGFAFIQANLIYHYLKAHGTKKYKEPEPITEFPIVTLQLPIYNELYVVEDLLEDCAKIDYPADRFEIQVLDDSTDETVQLIAAKVEEIRKRGIDIIHVRRDSREGYKAGALKYGMKICKGEFIAIFDADFLPSPDFLRRTIPEFSNPQIGMVQTRWDHINRNYSRLTKSQAFGLDAHFTVEQTGRYSGGYFMNFNGTSGIWRKSCIEDAGGWQSDTITEDMDLSFRAQLKGWKFKYMEEVASPSELPVTMDAWKSQQYRWNKGSAETTKKILGKVYASKISFAHKLHATFHLLGNFNFICVITTALISVPLLQVKANHPELRWFFQLASVAVIGFFVLGLFYWISNKRDNIHRETDAVEFFVDFILFLSTVMGMSLHNSLAFISGLLGFKSAFVRTPKFHLLKGNRNWTTNKYVKIRLKFLTLVEMLTAAYFAYALYLAFKYKDYGLMPFHLMLFFGFAYVVYLTFEESFEWSFLKRSKVNS